jgi:DnaJ-class molecular chaperone
LPQDPYQELGVAKSATADEIRRAFRKLAKAHHPDANPGNKAAEERFKRVSRAFDILGDPEKKAKFDRGEIDADGRETMRGGPWGGAQRGPQAGQGYGRGAQFEDVDISEILGEMFGARAAGAAGGAGGGGRPFNFGFGQPQKGPDVRARLEIDIEDAINGAKKRISFSDGRTIDVSIPKGAVEGQVMRLKGQGQMGQGGPGDALIEIGIRPHPIYRREGDLLVMDLPVSVPDAVLGGKAPAPTPDGTVSLTIPKGSNTGQTLRLKGRGLPDPKTGKRGDLLARIVVSLPDTPDPELEKFAEDWRRERPYTPRRKG